MLSTGLMLSRGLMISTGLILCSVRALRWYVDWTQSFRTSDQHFVCYGSWQKGDAVSKQRMAHWAPGRWLVAPRLQTSVELRAG